MLSWVRNKRLISRILIIKLVLAFGVVTFFPVEVDAAGRVRVRGYYRKDGTYVRPHYRSAPDGNPYNNYSFPGNYNPNTDRITPGNPQTYLNRYYDRSSTSSTTFDFDKWLKDLEKQTKTSGNVNVRGYFRSNGTYVKPHTRTAPDGNPYNNYSYPGNYNPNTGNITPGNSQTYLDRYYNKSSSNSTRSYKSTRRNYNPKTRKISFGNFFKRFRLGERKPTLSTRQSPKSSFFTVGSTKSEVIAVQGTPDSSTETHLSYGSSTVYLEDGRVKRWHNSFLRPLKAKTHFTVGSTKSEVIAVQGTPDSSTETHLSYGLSIVYFRDGRVTSWKSYYPDVLKVK